MYIVLIWLAKYMYKSLFQSGLVSFSYMCFNYLDLQDFIYIKRG